MSYRKEKFLSLAGGDLNKLNIEELKTLARKILKNSVHGICFSPYDENQRPGDKLDSQNVKEKLDFIKPHFSWCRSFHVLRIMI